jgi:hypothetical protein
VAVFVLPSNSLVVVSSSVTVTVRPLSSVNVSVFFSTCGMFETAGDVRLVPLCVGLLVL